MKKLVSVIFILFLICVFVPNALAFTWYFGTDADATYTASYPSTEFVVWLPITIVGENELMAGAHGPASVLLLDGVPGNYTTFDFNTNLAQSWGVYGTANIDNAFSIQIYHNSGLTSLPDGVYTGDVSSTGLRLGAYDTPDRSGNYRWLTPENNFRITVGPQTNEGDGNGNPVPEPATMLLFGPALLGLLRFKRKIS